MASQSSIVVCGQRFDIGERVITWMEDPQVSAYTEHRTDQPREIHPWRPALGMAAATLRYRPRWLLGGDRSLGRLGQVIRQLVVHHDGCQSSRACFNVLHNERGLSVHFLIDNDGTVFQTLDLVDCAFHAAGVNEISVGVELSSRGDALRFPSAYHGQRDKVTCTINGHQFLAYEYTRAQLASLIAIGKALARLFPNLPTTFPSTGVEPLWKTLAGAREYAGYLGHYHVSANKWDPGPFDFKQFSSKIGGRSFFPLLLSAGAARDIPDDPEQADELASQLCDNNETEGEGGYYPVGPFGESRLWHGGIHLRAERGTPVRAPFAGEIVLARMTTDCAIGSRNFVLIRHQLTVGAQPVTFWTLLFHLELEPTGAEVPAWFEGAGAQLGDDPVSLRVSVQAGELVGHVGEAGPPGRFDGQIHFEIMSADPIGERLEPGFWRAAYGGTSHFCETPEILEKIDKPSGGSARDGQLSRLELLNFFRGDPARAGFRRLAVHHLSEWTNDDAWRSALGNRLYQEQIEPVSWWTDELGAAAGLPADKRVWSYHPIAFVLWLRDRIQHAPSRAIGIGPPAEFGGGAAPPEISDDREATEGFTSDEDLFFGKLGKNLELEDLARGYPDDD